jgi:type I site-specific restriction endonuclease
MIWRAGLTNTPTEIITGVSQTKIETELFVTDKDKVERLPEKDIPKKKPASAGITSKRKSVTRSSTAKPQAPKVHSMVDEEKPVANKSAVRIGDAFRSLKPEVQTTLDKIFSQVELVSGTLALLDKRLQFSENRMMEVMNYIKDSDVSHRPRLVPGYPSFNLENNPAFNNNAEPDYIVRPQMENLNINSGLSNDSH